MVRLGPPVGGRAVGVGVGGMATRPHHFQGAAGPRLPREMALSDGGVYDNMGEQWARGFASRVERRQELGAGRRPPARLVVVNASARVPWAPFRGGRVPLLGEVLALKRVNDVMYVNTTNVRRQEIVGSFDPLASGRRPERDGPRGVLVQIAQTPFDVADAFSPAEGEPARRARDVLAALGDSRREWVDVRNANISVATTLRTLGVDASARLLRQGWVVAMCNLHVLFGEHDFPLLPIPSQADLESLVVEAEGDPGARAAGPADGSAADWTSATASVGP